MAKFRKKPVVISAVQFVALDQVWPTDWPVQDWLCRPGQLVVPTAEGSLLASIGDWIVRGVEGEFYPVSPSVFEKTYDAVQE